MQISFSVHIPGLWQDVWLYKENLLLWDREGQLFVGPLSRVRQEISGRRGEHLASLSDYMLWRNDWKSGEQFRRLNYLPPVAKAIFSPAVDEGGRVHLVIDPERVLTPVSGEPVPGSILDSQVYANRIYIGSTNGLFESYIRPHRPADEAPLELLLERRVTAVSAKYQALNASAEESGLWFGGISFGVEFDAQGRPGQPLEQIADSSFKTSFAGRNLLNYSGDDALFLRALGEIARPHPQARFENFRVEGFEAERPILDLAVEALEGRNLVKRRGRDAKPNARDIEEGTGEARIVGNSNYHLLLVADGRYSVVDVSAFDGEELKIRPSKSFKPDLSTVGSPEDLLEVHSFGSGFVSEGFDEVTVIDKSGATEIYSSPVARVRTFPDSRRHSETVALVADQEAVLVGLFNLVGDPVR